MRSAKITYSNGQVIETSLAANLTDKEIKNYFIIGREFNIGNGPDDNMQTVVKCEISPLRGLIVEVYRPLNRDGSVSDCTNDGLSSKATMITLCGDGIPEIFTANEDAPAFRVVKRNIFPGEDPYIHVEPWERPSGSGWMFGGNLCYDSDSRFPNRYPLQIHDRQEF